MILGIEAININSGGGFSHLKSLIESFTPNKHFFNKIIIWGKRTTLEKITNTNLVKISHKVFEKGPLYRAIWLKYSLPKEIVKHKCDILFVPSGSYLGSFRPYVALCQNMLPFEPIQRKKYGFSKMGIRLKLLKSLQAETFRNSNGSIFLTRYAQEIVSKISNSANNNSTVIPHGLSERFIKLSRKGTNRDLSCANIIKIVYVSTIDVYKNQWTVVQAMKLLRDRGFNIELELVGAAYEPAKKKFDDEVHKANNINWIKYRGELDYLEIHKCYQSADIGLFASSCENLPNILLEMMGSGLPIACSNKGPMPDVLKDNGEYFDPENHKEIANAVYILITNNQLRASYSKGAKREALNYNWDETADRTYYYLFQQVVERY